MPLDPSASRQRGFARACFGTRHWYLPLAALALVVAVSILWVDHLIFYGTEDFRSIPAVQRAGEIAAEMGHRPAVAVVIMLLIFLSRHRWRRMMPAALTGVVMQYMMVRGLKTLTGRSRPGDLHDLGVPPAFYGIGYDGNSFPSGHATIAFMLATLASAYFPRWRRLAYALAVFVALGRMALDKHFLSDVTMGAAIGYLVACVVLYIWPVPDRHADSSRDDASAAEDRATDRSPEGADAQ